MSSDEYTPPVCHIKHVLTQTSYQRKPSSVTQTPQWWSLDYKELSEYSVPYNGTHFHSHPYTAALVFCLRHLHRSLCTHNM